MSSAPYIVDNCPAERIGLNRSLLLHLPFVSRGPFCEGWRNSVLTIEWVVLPAERGKVEAVSRSVGIRAFGNIVLAYFEVAAEYAV